MADKSLCPCAEECPVQKSLSSIGGKWKLPIICSLAADGPSRYNELLKRVRGISNTMLSQTLKRLEQIGLISRQVYPEVPPRVEYSLTARGQSLMPHVNALIGWALEHFEEIAK